MQLAETQTMKRPELRTQMVLIRTTPTEKQMLQQVADKLGTTVSKAIRQLAKRELTKK